MGKIISLVAGSVAALVGVVLLIAWWGEFLILLKGVIPGILVLAGVVSVVAGISEFKDTIKERSEKT